MKIELKRKPGKETQCLLEGRCLGPDSNHIGARNVHFRGIWAIKPILEDLYHVQGHYGYDASVYGCVLQEAAQDPESKNWMAQWYCRWTSY